MKNTTAARLVSGMVACALLLLLPGVCVAAVAPTDAVSDERLSLDLETVLQRFHEAQERTSTLVADFTQVKSSSLLTQEETSKGRLYYSKPDKFLWAYTEPDDTLMLINGDTMLTWYKDLNRVQKVDIARKKKRIFHYFAIGEEVDTLRENFLITLRSPSESDPPGSVHLELVPKRRRVRDRLNQVDMWLDGKVYMPVELRYDESGGDYTIFHLENLQPNAVIEDDRFSFDIPKGTEIDETLSRPEQETE